MEVYSYWLTSFPLCGESLTSKKAKIDVGRAMSRRRGRERMWQLLQEGEIESDSGYF